MRRRIYVDALRPGRVELAPDQAHHLRDVLRLKAGTEVELFDQAGSTARGVLVEMAGRRVVVEVDPPREAAQERFRWTIAAAVPKANRADWMIEKLSELGTSAYIPLAAARSVAAPQGQNKMQRWRRLAAEAAQQSRRRGVMAIEPLCTPRELINQRPGSVAWYLSTQADALPIRRALEQVEPGREWVMLIGPEGGWTPEEIALFNEQGLTGVKLTETILRVETAAVAAAAVVACRGAQENRGLL